MKALRKLNSLIRMRSFSSSMARYLPKDDGKAGAIREAGGAFGKMEAAREDQYFYNLQKDQLHKLKSHMTDEISFHEEQIKRHEEAIRKAKEDLDKIEIK